MNVDLSNYKTELGKANQIKRFVWKIIWFLLVKPFPRRIAYKWTNLILRLFGAKIHKTAVVYSSAKIYAPWNLEMKEFSCLAPEVDCYNVDKIFIGANSTVSQKSYLCTATHDISKSLNPLVTKSIYIDNQSWIGASAYVGPGVKIGEGAVVGATASVYKNVLPWTIVGGNPAKMLKERKIEI